MSAIAELDHVALARDYPEHGLVAGDIGCVMMVHQDGAGYTIEFVSLGGETVAILTVESAAVRQPGTREIAHVREMV